MSEPKKLLPAVREADRALAAASLPVAASHRIRSAIREAGSPPVRRSRAWFYGGSAIGAAASLLAFRFLMHPRSAPPMAPPSDCVTTTVDDSIDLRGSCVMSLPTMRLETSGVTSLAETADGVLMTKGKVLFQVRAVPAGHPPIHVRVGGHVIEIVGTKFLVEKKEGGGSIELLEGTVRFLFATGRQSVLHAGERLTWVDDPGALPSTRERTGAAGATHRPDEARAPADLPHPDPASPAGSVGDFDPRDIAEEDQPSLQEAQRRFGALKRGARYTEAEHLRGELEPASFELGKALENAHVALPRVCGHWRWHLSRFPDGIYNGVVEGKVQQLGCTR